MGTVAFLNEAKEATGKGAVLVTGGAGFIGANFVLDWLALGNGTVVNLDKLTYAGNLHNLGSVGGDPRHIFIEGDIGDVALVGKLLNEHRPCAIVNFAAESHVDRSIHGPADFIATNIVGTYHLLESARAYLQSLSACGTARIPLPACVDRRGLRLARSRRSAVHRDRTPYLPNSPYSASKAAADHLVRAWHHTYGFRC